MAVVLQGGNRRFGRRRRPMMADINVTPMVDVMLVLLVIFMVTAPLLTIGVEVDLPQGKARNLPGEDEPLTVTVDKEGRIYLGSNKDDELELEQVAPMLEAISGANPDVRIFVRGDKAINYGRVMQVMGSINAAGFRRAALVMERPTFEPAAAAPKPARKKGVARP